ncbi:hypothetical protein RRG08_021417 [Elysia crispata]|uniref:Uncharacterized protein n=1 Tax=Elysia crispata TaxID=231223 RepID=A0AAE1DST9_9GAST|nr:hypothetical protein RRG08_021417 [Elysia crispata]
MQISNAVYIPEARQRRRENCQRPGQADQATLLTGTSDHCSLVAGNDCNLGFSSVRCYALHAVRIVIAAAEMT